MDTKETLQPQNYYTWTAEHMMHLSVGAVIVNDQNQILVLNSPRTQAHYFLPTKSHKPNATLEGMLALTSQRTGWEVEIENYLGVTTGEFPTEQGNVTKSVIWFKCKPISQVERDPEDRDHDAEVEWKSKAELMRIFADQTGISSDVDQRKVLTLLLEQ